MTGDGGLRGPLAFFVAVRAVSNTAYRMVYPFLPVFARSLGVDLGAMSLALSVRSGAGALGPLLAPWSDRHGRRFGLSLALALAWIFSNVAAKKPEVAWIFSNVAAKKLEVAWIFFNIAAELAEVI